VLRVRYLVTSGYGVRGVPNAHALQRGHYHKMRRARAARTPSSTLAPSAAALR
jgi:hypothetical protein